MLVIAIKFTTHPGQPSKPTDAPRLRSLESSPVLPFLTLSDWFDSEVLL